MNGIKMFVFSAGLSLRHGFSPLQQSAVSFSKVQKTTGCAIQLQPFLSKHGLKGRMGNCMKAIASFFLQLAHISPC
jgi:hypothetical protein